jgi:hypothetical protein
MFADYLRAGRDEFSVEQGATAEQNSWLADSWMPVRAGVPGLMAVPGQVSNDTFTAATGWCIVPRYKRGKV